MLESVINFIIVLIFIWGLITIFVLLVMSSPKKNTKNAKEINKSKLINAKDLDSYKFRIAIETRADNEKVYYAQYTFDGQKWFGLSPFGAPYLFGDGRLSARACVIDSYKDAEKAIMAFKHQFIQEINYVKVE